MLKESSPAALPQRLPVTYAYFCLYTGLSALALFCLAWLPFAIVLQAILPAQWGRWIGRRTITYVFRFYLWLLGILGACHFDLTELDALREAGPLILAPNHPSLLDAVMVISRLPDVACVMKADLMLTFFLAPVRGWPATSRMASHYPW